jgi:hypothetical protein
MTFVLAKALVLIELLTLAFAMSLSRTMISFAQVISTRHFLPSLLLLYKISHADSKLLLSLALFCREGDDKHKEPAWHASRYNEYSRDSVPGTY